MFLALHGKPPPNHLNNFITWILSEAEMKRRQSQALELTATLDELSHKCRLAQMKHGNRARVQATLKRNAEVAKKVNLITDYDFEDAQCLRVTCSSKVFTEAQEWAKRRQKPFLTDASSATPAKAAMDAPCLYPREIDKMLADVKAEIQAIESRRRVNWEGKVERELTAAENLWNNLPVFS